MADHAPVVRFPALHRKVIDVIGSMLERGKNEARDMVSNLIKVEVAWLNTSHPNFIGGRSVGFGSVSVSFSLDNSILHIPYGVNYP